MDEAHGGSVGVSRGPAPESGAADLETLRREVERLRTLDPSRDPSQDPSIEDRLDVITDALPVLVSYIGTDGNHHFVNRTFERWFGKPRAVILGKTIEALGQPLADQLRAPLARALAGQASRFQLHVDLAELPLLRERELEITMTPDLGPDGSVRGTVNLVVDVTEQRRLEARQEQTRLGLEASARRLAFLANASRVFADAESDLPHLLGVIARQTTLQFGEVGGLILHHRDPGSDPQDGEPFGAPELFALPGEPLEPLRRLFEPQHRDPLIMAILREIVRDGQPVSLSRSSSEEPPPAGVSSSGADLLARFPVAHALLVPLRVRDCVIGVLGCGRSGAEPRLAEYSDDERALLEQVAERAALSIEKSRLIAELNAVNAETDLLYELADSLNRTESLEGVFAPAVAAMARQLGRIGLGRCALLLFDPDGVIRFKAWNGLSERYRTAVEGHWPWPVDAFAPQVVLVPDVRLSPELAPDLELLEAEQVRALALIPLVHAGQPIGSFVLYSRQARSFSASDLRLTQTIADQVAKAVGRKRADAERERMIGELQRTVKSNELFARILGHDLRNPLGAILMSATVLSRKATDEGTTRTVARILSAGQRMNRMITQLLDFTQVRASGGMPIAPSWIDVAPIFQQAIDELLTGSGQTLARPELERQGDTRGWWDPDRLAQLASNLMSNAIRHGAPQQPIRVSMRADPRRGVVIEVRNGGIIPADLLPIIFDPFRRGELHERRSGGLGLGLFITREIVEAHRGSLGVACSDDETVFTVELPRGPDASDTTAPTSPGSAKPGQDLPQGPA
jgi:signal transduction histidine kinase